MPAKARLAPAKTREPSADAVIVTTGGLGAIVTCTAAVPTAPSESVTDATRVWLPSDRVAVRTGPGANAPSRLEVQRMPAVTSPSKSSTAVAPSVSGVPAGTAVPSAGPVIVTRGGTFGARTRTEMRVLPRRPSASVTVASITCVPTVSAPAAMLDPVPSAPSRSDVHVMCAPRSPSSTSVARAVSVSGRPLVNTTVPSAGATMVTAGGWTTVIATVAWPTSPPASVTRAVTVCRPGRSAAAVTVGPVPRGPSRLELHAMRLPRSPSSASIAAAVKTTGLPGSTRAAVAGASTVTTGGVFSVSAMRSSGRPVVASRLAYRTQSLELLTTARLTVPSPATPGVTSKSTTSFGFTAVRVASTAPSTAGRVL